MAAEKDVRKLFGPLLEKKLQNIQNLKPDYYRLTSCCTTEYHVKEAERLEVCAGQLGVHDDRDILDFSLVFVVFGSPSPGC